MGGSARSEVEGKDDIKGASEDLEEEEEEENRDKEKEEICNGEKKGASDRFRPQKILEFEN